MFISRSLISALIVATVSILTAGGCRRAGDKSNDTVAKDVTDEKKYEIQSDGDLTISGVVRDQAGMPVDGVMMVIYPKRDWVLYNYAEGKFKAERHARRSSESIQGNIFIARHVQRNLAAAAELDEDTNTLDVRLESGVILTGKVVDEDGKGIEKARVAINLQTSSLSRSLLSWVEVDDEGRFEFRALPPGYGYLLSAQRMGYRVGRTEVRSDSVCDNRIDVVSIVLPRGEFSVSGVVVDPNGKPVSNAWVYCTGKNQVGINSHTDAYGKFKADGIFEGQVEVIANIKGDNGRWLSGSINTESGATNVRVVLGTGGAPPPKGRACFPADTYVWVNGMVVQISRVGLGQTVGNLGCAVPTAAFGQIERLEEHVDRFECRDIVLENGNRISVVDAHCFMLDSGQWIAAQYLIKGLRLKTLNGTVDIKKVTTRTTPFVGKVYNLKVKGSDQYMVGKDGVIVRDY